MSLRTCVPVSDVITYLCSSIRCHYVLVFQYPMSLRTCVPVSDVVTYLCSSIRCRYVLVFPYPMSLRTCVPISDVITYLCSSIRRLVYSDNFVAKNEFEILNLKIKV
jgi:hypothetical protein